jgi:hypothetical protein
LNDSLKGARLSFSNLSRYAGVCSSLNKICSAALSGERYCFQSAGGSERLIHEIADLKQRISEQITLIQELAWEAQDPASAKKVLQGIKETLMDGYAHHDLLLKVRTTEPQPA